jgi:hypothetical protein
MTLFSWFIKTNSQDTYKHSNKRGDIPASNTVELNYGLADELDTLNHNTMWPIAKVKTTNMIMKKPITKTSTSQVIPQTTNTSLVTIPINI